VNRGKITVEIRFDDHPDYSPSKITIEEWPQHDDYSLSEMVAKIRKAVVDVTSGA
jgi:hypothetical protein